MSDFYTEQLVKRQPTAGTVAARAGLIGLTIVAAAGAFLIPILIILLVIAIGLDFFLLPRLSIEYEYLYVNGDLDVDVIINKQKRKKKFSMNISDMEMLAPADAAEIRNFRVDKTYDFSSGAAQNKKYEMIVANNEQRIKVMFEPNQTILEGMRMMAPRKVIL